MWRTFLMEAGDPRMLPQQTNNELHLVLKALSYLRTHWWLFLIELTLCMSFSFRNYMRTTPIYESNASVLIDSSRRALYQSVMPGVASAQQNSRKQNTQFLLTSQEVMERFRSQLTEHYNTEGRPAYLRAFFPGGVAVPGERLRGAVNLTWDKNSDIYNVRCSTQTPEAAHDLCLIYLNTVQAYYPEVGQRDSLMKREFLSRQIQSLTRQIQEREQNLRDFQKKNADFINYVIESMDGAAIQKLQSESNVLKQKLSTNRATKRLMLVSPTAKRGELTARAPSIDALTTRVSELQYQRDLVAQNTNDADRAFKLSTIDAEIARISTQLAKLNEDEVQAYLKNPLSSTMVRTRVSELEIEYRTDQIRLQSIGKEILDFQQKEAQYQPQSLEYERLQAELNHRRKLLSNLFVKEQETEIELSAGNAEIFRLSEPSRQARLVAPILAKFMYSGLSLAIVFIGFSLFILVTFFPRLDSEAEVNRLNLPVLGKIPRLPKVSGGLDDIPSAGFEFLKIMNYRILRETKDVKCPVLVISSSHTGEGKSTVTQFLALASQAPNRKALLIDGDLLTSHPNKFLGFEEDETLGLKAIIEGNVPVGGPMSLVARTMHEGIYFLPRGGRMEPSATPNSLDPAKRMLEVFRKEFDIIIIDTPPIFAANLSHQWLGVADLIVLVTRIFVTRPKDILESLQTCKVFSKAPIGIALNCVQMSGATKRASNYYFSRRKHKTTRLAA